MEFDSGHHIKSNVYERPGMHLHNPFSKSTALQKITPQAAQPRPPPSYICTITFFLSSSQLATRRETTIASFKQTSQTHLFGPPAKDHGLATTSTLTKESRQNQVCLLYILTLKRPFVLPSTLTTTIPIPTVTSKFSQYFHYRYSP